VEHEKRRALGLFPWVGGVPLDGPDERKVAREDMDQLGEGLWEIAEGTFSPHTGEGDGVGNAPLVWGRSVSESPERASGGHVIFAQLGVQRCWSCGH